MQGVGGERHQTCHEDAGQDPLPWGSERGVGGAGASATGRLCRRKWGCAGWRGGPLFRLGWGASGCALRQTGSLRFNACEKRRALWLFMVYNDCNVPRAVESAAATRGSGWCPSSARNHRRPPSFTRAGRRTPSIAGSALMSIKSTVARRTFLQGLGATISTGCAVSASRVKNGSDTGWWFVQRLGRSWRLGRHERHGRYGRYGRYGRQRRHGRYGRYG